MRIKYRKPLILQQGVRSSEVIEPEAEVVNPPYRKISRLESKFYPLAEQSIDGEIDKLPAITTKQAEYVERITHLREIESDLIVKKVRIPARIKLKTESKMLMNIIKMICYRAESAMADLAVPYLTRAREERRMFIKQIINNNADLIPDYNKNTLTVILHSLSSPRFNKAANELNKILNESQIIFPGTKPRLIYKTTAPSVCEE